MQRAFRRQPFDCGDLGAILHDGEREAGIDAPSVNEHRAGATLAVVTTLFGASQVGMIPQCVQQSGPRCNFECSFDAVDGYRYRNLVRYRDRIPASFRRTCLSHLNLRHLQRSSSAEVSELGQSFETMRRFPPVFSDMGLGPAIANMR